MSKELIIFKKDTDAVGTNRGFVYQYLKTLIQWLSNYQLGNDNLIYCEVEDDIKQINRDKTTIQWSQIKCYSSVFNLGSREIVKSLYNFFILFISYSEYNGSFTFETNSKVSSKDELLIQWIKLQPLIESDLDLLSKLVVHIQQTLKDAANEEKSSHFKEIAKKIKTLETKKSSAAKKKVNQLKEKLQTTEKLAQELEHKISNIESVSDFISRINWIFDDIDPSQSIQSLKKQAIELLEQINTQKIGADLYFNRLISEIFFKSIETEIEDRCLDNELLAEILNETENQIKENIDQEFMNRFNGIEGKLVTGFENVNSKLDTLAIKIDAITETASTIEEMPLINLPILEDDELKKILEIEPEKQSKLEMKIRLINIRDSEQQDLLINIATELRCRYLLFLQKLKFENLHAQYEAIKSLEAKVKRHCTDTVINNDEDELEPFNPRIFWKTFQEDLKLLLKELRTRKKVDIEEDIVFAQMYQMAAECHLRWHKKDEKYE